MLSCLLSRKSKKNYNSEKYAPAPEAIFYLGLVSPRDFEYSYNQKIYEKAA